MRQLPIADTAAAPGKPAPRCGGHTRTSHSVTATNHTLFTDSTIRSTSPNAQQTKRSDWTLDPSIIQDSLENIFVEFHRK